MKRFDCVQILILSSLLLPRDASAGQPVADGLTQLPYNNPGLTVDLGVGLWAWPVPCDADGDGDFDLIVSCPDKPSNGVWLFENTQGDTATHKMPVFEPAKFLSRTVHYVMPSYVDGGMRVLAPGSEYADFTKVGLAQKTKLPIESNFHKPLGTQPKGPKVRHNQWRYADYNGDDVLDLVVGIEDWSYYGWDDAWNKRGEWTNGTLHGWVYVFVNNGSNTEPAYEPPFFVEAAGERLNVFGCPSPNFEDFDNDGDLDLICGEFLDGFTWFENTGSRTSPVYAAGIRLMNDQQQPLTMDLEMIVPVAFDWDKDGDKDLIVGDEDGRVALVENMSAKSQQGPPQLQHPSFEQPTAVIVYVLQFQLELAHSKHLRVSLHLARDTHVQNHYCVVVQLSLPSKRDIQGLLCRHPSPTMNPSALFACAHHRQQWGHRYRSDRVSLSPTSV